jgi:hypothetical protein
MECDSDGSCGGPSELSEGEFACYGDALGGGGSGCGGADSGGASSRRSLDGAGSPRAAAAETLNPAALEEARLRDTFLVSHVRDGLSLETAKELLVRHRWDARAALRSDDAGTPPASQPADDDTALCPVCQNALAGPPGGVEDDSGGLAHAGPHRLFFAGCAPGARHAGHAACLADMASAAIADALAGEAHRPGTVPCPVCVAEGAAAPGALTEAQVAQLVPAEAMELYRKARGPCMQQLPRAQTAAGKQLGWLC